jgi:hypothetical protein
MTEVNWTPIAITGRSEAGEVGDRVEVEWKLSAKPDLEWAEVFQMVDLSEREGSMEWVLGGGPDVIGDVIRWFVPGKEIDQADAEVRHRLYMANGRSGIERSTREAGWGHATDARAAEGTAAEPTTRADGSD